jgi:hypothetical protein
VSTAYAARWVGKFVLLGKKANRTHLTRYREDTQRRKPVLPPGCMIPLASHLPTHSVSCLFLLTAGPIRYSGGGRTEKKGKKKGKKKPKTIQSCAMLCLCWKKVRRLIVHPWTPPLISAHFLSLKLIRLLVSPPYHVKDSLRPKPLTLGLRPSSLFSGRTGLSPCWDFPLRLPVDPNMPRPTPSNPLLILPCEAASILYTT